MRLRLGSLLASSKAASRRYAVGATQQAGRVALQLTASRRTQARTPAPHVTTGSSEQGSFGNLVVHCRSTVLQEH